MALRTPLRVIVIGTSGAFTRPIFQQMFRHHQVVAVVESAPRQAAPVTHSRLEAWAAAHRTPFLRFSKATAGELVPFLAAARAQVGCVASMTSLLPPEALLTTPWGFLNVHPSLLPDLRGPNPWFWTYHAMAREAGVSVIRLDAGEDTGDILRQQAFPVPLGMPPHALIHRAAELGAQLVLDALDGMAAGECRAIAQRHLPCTLRARAVRRDEPLVPWEAWPIERVYHVVRGTRPWHDALPTWHDRPLHAVGFERRVSPEPARTVGWDARGLYVAHPEGRIRVLPGLFGRFLSRL